jgi:hypothetical protein
MKISKAILLVLVSLCLTIPLQSQKSDKKQKIKSITVLEEKSDVLVKKQVKDSETFYDPQGNIIEDINYKQGKISKHFRYQYDIDGNKIKEEELDPSGRLIEYSQYRYENGLRVEKVVYTGSNKIKSRKVYQYTTY